MLCMSQYIFWHWSTSISRFDSDGNINKIRWNKPKPNVYAFPDLQKLEEGPNKELFDKLYNSDVVENVQVIKVTNGDFEENKLFIQYKGFEPFTIELEYKYICDKLIDDERYENVGTDTKERKKGFRDGAVQALVTAILDVKYEGKIPSHTAYVDVCSP